jgi:hypothetical protein
MVRMPAPFVVLRTVRVDRECNLLVRASGADARLGTLAFSSDALDDAPFTTLGKRGAVLVRAIDLTSEKFYVANSRINPNGPAKGRWLTLRQSSVHPSCLRAGRDRELPGELLAPR